MKHSHSLSWDSHPAESTPLWNDHLMGKIHQYNLKGHSRIKANTHNLLTVLRLNAVQKERRALWGNMLS